MNNKYEFTGVKRGGLKQIRALRSFGAVVKGDIGGWIGSEKNLSHDGSAWVSGYARVYGDARVVYGPFNGNSTTDFKAAILATLRVLPVGSDYILYKRVNKVRDGVFKSCRDSRFKYVTGQESSVDNPSTDPLVSCGSGLHVADPLYWQGKGGDTLIACQFRLEDVLAVQEGKVRVRRLLCLGEVTV